ncbi:hypothetical protein O1611_g9546 [Lasiodiplodia mahajangana]|uniref:Uncharacterized protein n=1 Tax=Lasiodiplodia mahajangana TaxID=1108764 RepID=A0ACC2J8A9_9PEZI|nr:hypothetical protein O1611_g9546 [Lasiodiplodia mahajangana]
MPLQQDVGTGGTPSPSPHQRLGLSPSLPMPAPTPVREEAHTASRLLTRSSDLLRPADAGIARAASRVAPLELPLTQDELALASEITRDSVSRTSSNPKEDNDRKHNRLIVLNKSRLFGKTHWTNPVYEFNRISTFLNSEARSSGGQIAISAPPQRVAIRTLLQQCKHLSRNIKTIRPGRFLTCPDPIVSSPSMADHLVHLYQSNFESAFRILHGPSFRKDYDSYKASPDTVPDVTVLKIQLVIAIGSGLCTELANAKEVHKAACQWLYTAQDWLSGPIEKNRLSLDCLQVHCLLIIARQVLSVGGDLTWVAMGTLLRTATQMGLHRDPKHFSQLNVFQAEMRRRLWATILELNVQASLDSGTLPGISYGDFDTCPPANVNDEEIDETTTAIKQHDETAETDTTVQRFLLQHLPPRLEMLRQMNGIGTNLDDEKILALSSKFGTACREISVPNCAGHDFRQNMASLLLRRFLLVLHRPLAGRIRENALYYHSRKVCFDSAMALLKPPLSNEAFSYLALRGGGLFKSCLTHVSLALASEMLIEIEEKGPSTYRKMLIDAVREARERWVERLKLGDTNVRIHMKLTIVLSQAEDGGEEGTLTQQHMIQSAKDSLETCYSLIKANVSSSSAGTSFEHDGWSGERLHSAPGNRAVDLPDYSLSLGDILQMNGSEMDGIFESDIMTL